MSTKGTPAEADRAAHIARGEKLHEQVKEGVKTIVSAVLIAVVLRSFLFEPFNIPSASMLPGLLVGDYLFVAKWPYGYSRYSFPFGPPIMEGRVFERQPERGDVIVFRNPANVSQDYIKRVIGLPGDQIQMRSGQLFLNGQPVPKRQIEDFVFPVTRDLDCPVYGSMPPVREDAAGGAVCRYRQYEETLPGGRSYRVLDQVDGAKGDNTQTFVVRAGHYFMMGDNRDDSADSRFAPYELTPGIGQVPAENLVGRATVMWFSIDGTARWYAPWTWPGAIRLGRIGTLL
jgi:signal peptidase I